MTEEMRDSTDDYKPLLTKWLKYLIYTHIAGIGCTLVSGIPFLSIAAGWISTAISAVLIVILFQLGPVCARYRKAAIFSGVVLAAGLLSKTVLSLVISVCSLVAVYQEYQGHSEIVAELDPALSGRWNSLFHIQLFAGIIGAVAASASVLIGVMANMDEQSLAKIVAFCILALDTVLKLIYIRYLVQTEKIFEV